MSSFEHYRWLLEEVAKQAADEEFPHVVDVLRSLLSKPPTLTPFDREQLREFARFLQARARLRFPYWSDDRMPFVEAHETEYLEFVNGVWGKFASFLSDELGVSTRDDESS